ncbi:MAG: 5-oxoprolinase subunit PpxA [Sediminibacterium sp.]
MTIDLNCDMGEGLDTDVLLMPYITSANIACGYHAGDTDTMKRTIGLALQHRVAIGAHPGFSDRANFGRTNMQLAPEAITELVREQIHILQKAAATFQVKLHHVKPHGALYNMAARDPVIAGAVARAVKETDASLVLFGLSGSHSVTEAVKLGLQTASEVFADRTYQDDGSLTPRSQPNALIDTMERSLQQVLQMIRQRTVTSIQGKQVAILAETVCIHGDGDHALAFAKNIYQALQQQHIEIKAI